MDAAAAPGSLLSDDDGSTPLRIASLHAYPVKACGGLSLARAELIDTGFDPDRLWMLVDGQGRFVSQREIPRLARVQTSWSGGDADVLLRAPGMLALHLPIDRAGPPLRVRVWDDEFDACTMDARADQWFSDFVGPAAGVGPLRLVRFDPEVRRPSSRRWTGEVEALNAFSDGYPILVTSSASLADLNRRLQARGQPPVTMERFRPNLVLDGLPPYGEDGLDELRFDTADGPVVLRLVKPCPRCPVPNIDPFTAERGTEPGDTLASYRADPRLDGAITFGMNAVIVEGIGRALRLGQSGRGHVRF